MHRDNGSDHDGVTSSARACTSRAAAMQDATVASAFSVAIFTATVYDYDAWEKYIRKLCRYVHGVRHSPSPCPADRTRRHQSIAQHCKVCVCPVLTVSRKEPFLSSTPELNVLADGEQHSGRQSALGLHHNTAAGLPSDTASIFSPSALRLGTGAGATD